MCIVYFNFDYDYKGCKDFVSYNLSIFFLVNYMLEKMFYVLVKMIDIMFVVMCYFVQ